MPVYAYRALAPRGAPEEKKIEALSEEHAKSLLASRGEHVVHIREEVERQASHSGRKKPSIDEVASTIRQMSILVRAGVPLVEGLKGLAEQARAASLRECLSAVAHEVSQGGALSDAFSRHPSIFPKLAVEMARIAEAGGSLSESMARLADHMEYTAEITRKVKSAMAYPIVVLCISVATVLTMVPFIFPRFMTLFDRMHAKLPWTTKALMNLSNVLTGFWYLFVIGAVGGYFALRSYVRSASGKRTIDSLALKLPVVGDVVNKVVLSRAVASMSTLLSSGVPMVQALETSASAADNEVVKEALLKASEDVAQGSATSQSLKASGVFPPLVLQMVASGEQTGELPTMLDYVCTMYGRETDARVKSLTSIIEPIMIVILGVVVGFIAISVIVPIYSLVGGVK